MRGAKLPPLRYPRNSWYIAPVKGALPVTPEEVAAAHRRLHGVCHRTMMFTCSALDREAGCRAVLKGENFQRVGAFKLRGAYNFLAQMEPEARAKGVVAASSGNHGQGVAYAARLAGLEAHIFLAKPANPVKRAMIAVRGLRPYSITSLTVLRLDRKGGRHAKHRGAPSQRHL